MTVITAVPIVFVTVASPDDVTVVVRAVLVLVSVEIVDSTKLL